MSQHFLAWHYGHKSALAYGSWVSGKVWWDKEAFWDRCTLAWPSPSRARHITGVSLNHSIVSSPTSLSPARYWRLLQFIMRWPHVCEVIGWEVLIMELGRYSHSLMEVSMSHYFLFSQNSVLCKLLNVSTHGHLIKSFYLKYYWDQPCRLFHIMVFQKN